MGSRCVYSGINIIYCVDENYEDEAISYDPDLPISAVNAVGKYTVMENGSVSVVLSSNDWRALQYYNY